MAGIGRCPHQNFGQSSCLLEGRIDASCCVDSLTDRACKFQPGITDGILCCRFRQHKQLQADKPIVEAVMTPPMQMVKQVGERIKLRCPLFSEDYDFEDILWMKDGLLAPQIMTSKNTFKLKCIEGIQEFFVVISTYYNYCIAANVANVAKAVIAPQLIYSTEYFMMEIRVKHFHFSKIKIRYQY